MHVNKYCITATRHMRMSADCMTKTTHFHVDKTIMLINVWFMFLTLLHASMKDDKGTYTPYVRSQKYRDQVEMRGKA